MALPLRKDDELFTYGDYLTWPDEERWELIEGIPFDMSPAPSTYHQKISMNLSVVIGGFIKEKKGDCEVFAAPFDVRLAGKNQTDEETLNVVQPDISVICDPEKIDDRGCKGAPNLIIEIVSPGTTKKDLKYKFRLYEKYGVAEYWIIHPGEQTVEVFKLNKEKTYDRSEVYFKDDTIPLKLKEALLEIKLESVF